MTEQDSLKIVRLGQLKKFYDLLEDVAKTGVASDVAVTAITGVNGANVQAVLENLAQQVGDWKDKVVSGGFGAIVSGGNITVKNGQVLQEPIAATGVADGTYLVLNIENSESPVFVPAQQLVDVYTAAQNAGEVQLSISNSNVISAEIIELNGSKLAAGSVVEGKLADAVVTKLSHAETAYGWGNHADAGYAIAANTTSKGAANKGVYFDANGVATAMTYELNKTVPSDAVFTDTTYSNGDGIDLSGTVFSAKVKAENGLGVNTTNGISMSLASESAAGAMSSSDFNKLKEITYATDGDIESLFV